MSTFETELRHSEQEVDEHPRLVDRRNQDTHSSTRVF